MTLVGPLILVGISFAGHHNLVTLEDVVFASGSMEKGTATSDCGFQPCRVRVQFRNLP